MAGGSSETETETETENGNRDRDNGEYYSGGLGVHYILEKNNGSITEST